MTEQSPAEAIFFAALEKAAEERAAYLDAACGEDRNLRQRVERLLAVHPQVGSFLEAPAHGKIAVAEAVTLPPAENDCPAAGQADTSSYHRSSDAAGALIAGRYKLVEKIGEGGMGTVWVAQQTEPVKRVVAVKLIKAGMDSKAVLARFDAERQALALMEHPNIARVLDGGAMPDGRPYFVMELVKGVTITEFCDTRKLTPRQRLELFIPVCQAIQHAHQKGIIHRDIKPSNVLIALYDDRPVPKVIDFGVAKATGQTLTDKSLMTGFGAVVGTPEYMSPEQAGLNNLDIDTRSDVYSLGVLLYELLAGSPPFRSEELQKAGLIEMLRMVCEDEPPRPSIKLSTANKRASISADRGTEPKKLTGLLRNELDWIVMKALEKDRTRRYDTVNGLGADVQRYLAGEAVQAHPPSAAYRLRKFARKHRVALVTAMSFSGLLIVAAAVSSWLAVKARQAEAVADEKRIEADKYAKEAGYNLGMADQSREHAEELAASLQVDLDLTEMRSDPRVGILRLAETRRTIPGGFDGSDFLGEYTALSILAWGQRLHPIIGSLNHGGYGVNDAILSPDGLTLMTAGSDGTVRLWDSITGKQRATLSDPLQKRRGRQDWWTRLQFGADGKTALTVVGGPPPPRDYGLTDWDGGGDRVVRLWDVGTGQLRSSMAEHKSGVVDCVLSRDGSLLATSCVKTGRWTIYLWNASTGNLLRKLEFQGSSVDGRPVFDVSPDGKNVLIAHNGIEELFVPQEGSPPKRLPGNPASGQRAVAFSPGGRSAVTISNGISRWWNVADWQLQRTMAVGNCDSLRFINDDILALELASLDFFGPGSASCRVYIKALSEPIEEDVPADLVPRDLVDSVTISSNGRLLTIGSHVYDALSGQRLPVPRKRKFPPELSQFSEDGRFSPPLDSCIVDLAADKRMDLGSSSGVNQPRADVRFLKGLDVWVALGADKQTVLVLRKADASLDAELLQKWCQVIACGTLDESGQFRKLDEATWEKTRLELTRLLDANPTAVSLRSAVTDRLYWLRQEIGNSSTPLPLLDRLVAAEPTWPNYHQRAAANVAKERWVEAVRDDLETARLAGDRYWLQPPGSFPKLGDDWVIGFRIVQTAGRPREHYELALRWGEAKSRAGISDEKAPYLGNLTDTVTNGLALYRLGRYSDALATLRKRDVWKLSHVTGMLMSPWNQLLYYPAAELPGGQHGGPGVATLDMRLLFAFDPVDLIVRAMCYHHLGQPQEARASLQEARRQVVKNSAPELEARTLLNEAEVLIGGKAP